MFATLSVSSKLPKKGFVPALIANKLFKRVMTLVLMREKFVTRRGIDCVVLVDVSTFLITIVQAPLATVILVARVAKRFRIFCPSIIMNKLACCFARLLRVGPFGIALCGSVVGAPSFRRRGHCALSMRVVAKSCLSNGRIGRLELPRRYVVVGMRHSQGSLAPTNAQLVPKSRMRVRVSTRSVRGLCRPLMDVTGVCWWQVM